MRERHDRHFPWCEAYDKDTSWTTPPDFDTEVGKEEVQFEVVTVLKKRLMMYGASVSGKKVQLVQRLRSHMDDAPPDLGIGSWYHFDKVETFTNLEKYCKTHHIMVPTG